MTYRLTTLLLLAAAPLAAQQPAGDEAWSQGRFGAARAAYERVLAEQPDAFRANLRLGLMLSWQGKLDSALVHIARARAADPADLEARLIQARVMSWDGRTNEAVARYDSVLAEQPGNRDAAVGRAQALSWAGQLRKAEAAYHAVLAEDPRNVDALVGLGYVYHWQSREGPAIGRARAALEIDPTNQAALRLHDEVRAATRATVETSANWGNDSDRNTTFWQTLTASTPLTMGVRAFGSVDALQASDPLRDATRVGGEAGLTWAFGRMQLTGAAGARQLSPESAGERTGAIYRGRASYRPVSTLGLSAGYARAPFDEIAALIERDLDFEILDAGFDVALARGLSVYGTGSGTWFSDGNYRTSVLAGINQTIRRRFVVGLFGRTLRYEERGIGYFSPDEFTVLEAQAGYGFETNRWLARVGGGLGAQQVGSRGEAQSEWHVEARVGRRWGVGNRVEAFGLLTNSAISSTSGAYRYRSAGVVVRLGL